LTTFSLRSTKALPVTKTSTGGFNMILLSPF
jgi:hypothetical protein